MDCIPGSQHLPHRVTRWKAYVNGSGTSIPSVVNAFYLKWRSSCQVNNMSMKGKMLFSGQLWLGCFLSRIQRQIQVMVIANVCWALMFRHCFKPFTWTNSFNIYDPRCWYIKMRAGIILLLQIRKLRFRKVKRLAQDCTANKQQN